MRKTCRATATLLLFAMSILFCLGGTPGAARAAELFTTRVETVRLVTWFRLTDGTPIVVPVMTMVSEPGTPAYCLTPHSNEPYPASMVGYAPCGPEALFDNAAFIQGVTAIVQHGYPSTSTFNGVAFPADQAQYATNVAIWWLHASLGLPGSVTSIAGARANGNESLFEAARQLYEIGLAQRTRPVSLSIEPARWAYRAGRLECSARVTQTNLDMIAVSACPPGVEAVFDGSKLQLATTGLPGSGAPASVEVSGFSTFSNENLYWLSPDNASYQSVVAVSGISRFCATATMTPEYRTGSLVVQKTDEAGNRITTSPAVFQLISADTGLACGFTPTPEGKYLFGGSVTDLPTSGGVLSLDGIPEAPGGWLLREIAAPAGHLRMESDLPVVPQTPAARIDVGNWNEMVTVRVVKRDAQTGDRPQGDAFFAGARFEIWHKDYSSYEAAPEDRRDIVEIPVGSATAESRPLRGGRQPVFQVREITPPAGYRLFGETVEAVPGQNGSESHTAVVTIRDPVIQGRIGIQKRGERTAESPDPAREPLPLPGVSFTIRSVSTGQAVQTMETGPDGKALSDWLPYGRYEVAETAGPGNAGYVPAAPFEATINQDGVTVDFTIENQAVRTPLRIRKVDARTGGPIQLPGAAFQILYGDGRPVFFPGLSDDSDAKTVFESDEEGMITLPDGLTQGEYLAVEVAPPAGYALRPDPVPFRIGISGVDVLLDIPNLPTGLEIRKTDSSTGDPLGGVVFTLTRADGTGMAFLLDGPVYRPDSAGDPMLVAGEDGCIRIQGVPAGDYLLEETTPPTGYLLPANPTVAVRIGYGNDTDHPLVVEVRNDPVPAPEPTAAPTPPPTVTVPSEPLPQVPPIPPTGEGAYDSRLWIPASAAMILVLFNGVRNAWRKAGQEHPDRRNRRLL